VRKDPLAQRTKRSASSKYWPVGQSRSPLDGAILRSPLASAVSSRRAGVLAANASPISAVQT
jgi:hypothetical protein